MDRSYYVVDAFAAQPFSGNPAAVVIDASGMTDEQMQAIAAEFNLSETTFVLPPTGPATEEACASAERSIRFRWFTPGMEVDMCGHATIAAVHALVESGLWPIDPQTGCVTASIETRAGHLKTAVEPIPGQGAGRMIWLDLVDPVLAEQTFDDTELSASLGLPADAFDRSIPSVRSQDGDALVFVNDVISLNGATPDFARLRDLLIRNGLRGLSLATVNTLTPSVNVQSRFFAPPAGVDEDPVTGSVHGPLAAHLVQQGLVPLHDGVAGLTCIQAKAGGRAGLLFALVTAKEQGGYCVRIGGQAVTTMRGTLILSRDPPVANLQHVGS